MKIRMFAILPALLLGAATLAVADDGGRWKDNGNQTLTDTFTGLVWTKRDNLSDINQTDAMRYCDTLALAGGKWRLPSIDEVAALYSTRDGSVPCGTYKGTDLTCHVSSLFYLTMAAFWSSTSGSPDPDNGSARAWGVFLVTGDRIQRDVSYSANDRALCVRRS